MAAIVEAIRRRCSEKGAELIEFALVFPLLLLVVLGIIDFGFLFQKYEVVTNAAREGARIATLPTYGPSYAQNRVFEYLDAASMTDPGRTATVTPVALLSGDCGYQVQVTYPHVYSFVGGIMSYFGGTLSSRILTVTSTMRIEAVSGPCPP
jgi:Flp pilus assembly protein TadG